MVQHSENMNSLSPRLEVYLLKERERKIEEGGRGNRANTPIADFNAKVAESTKNSGSPNQICIAVNAIVMSKCSTELDLLACTMQSYISCECF